MIKGNVLPVDCKPRVGILVALFLLSPLQGHWYKDSRAVYAQRDLLSRGPGMGPAPHELRTQWLPGCPRYQKQHEFWVPHKVHGDNCPRARQGRDSQTTTTLTCGIAGTPDCSHLSSWGLLPDHGPKVVLITNLMGLCKGPDSEVDRVEGQ